MSVTMKILLILMAILTAAGSAAPLEEEMIVSPAGVFIAGTLRYVNTVTLDEEFIHYNIQQSSAANLHSFLLLIRAGQALEELMEEVKNF